MKIKQFLMIACLVVISASAQATWHTSKILTIHTFLNGTVRVYLHANHQCGSNYVLMDSSSPGFDRVYSALLAYEAQGKPVKFAINSCSGTTGIADRIVSVN